MKFGTAGSHQKVMKEIEEFMSYLKDLHIHHIYFERHA